MSDTQKGTLHLLSEHLATALEPLEDIFSDEDAFIYFLEGMGWEVTALLSEYASLAADVSSIIEQVENLADEPALQDVLDLLAAVSSFYNKINSLSGLPAGIDAADSAAFLADVTEELFKIILVEYMMEELPIVFQVFSALQVITIDEQDATDTRPAYTKYVLNLNKLPEAFNNPSELIATTYGWGTEDLDFDKMIGHIGELLAAFGVLVRIEESTTEARSGYLEDSRGARFESVLRILFLNTQVGGVPVEAGLVFMKLPAENGQMPGFVIQPLIPSEIGLSYALSEVLTLTVDAQTNLESTLGILIRPEGLSVKYPGDGSTDLPSAGINFGLTYAPDSPLILLGNASESRLEMQGAELGIGVNTIGGEIVFQFDAGLSGLAVVLRGGEGDNFIGKLLGDEEQRIDIPLGIEWSSNGGLKFTGGGGFQIAVATHFEVGPISFDNITFDLSGDTEEKSITAAIGTGISGDLGPLQFVLEGIGVQLIMSFNGGNAGPFDLDLGFKPPDGIGLSIDAQGFKGGGYLYFNHEEKSYAGALEFEFQSSFSLKIVGLLTTQLPDGSDGYSLLLVISTEFTPIQLGFGFTLNGVGGLLGLHRTMEVEALRAGIKANTLDSLLFPDDLVANAPQIISALGSIFPVQEDQFVFGPMAIIGWGSPTLISLEIGLLIEIPDPIRIAIVGVLKALLPDEDTRLLAIQVNFVGVIDFEAKEISFDASLFDSKLLAFTLTGDMALRILWGDDANMLLSVGGFHPAYEPPPLSLPSLERLMVKLSSGDNPRLTLEAYFAVTSNTVQFGSRVELYAESGNYNVYGFLAFDVLFQFSPFYFIAQIAAMLAVRSGTDSLLSVNLSLSLEGPTPWSAAGTAEFKILGIKFKVNFAKTFGENKDTSLPDKDVLPLVLEALGNQSNWLVGLPSSSNLMVTVKQIDTADGTVVAHPFGSLSVSQKVVPLDVTIDKFGNQAPEDADYFEITEVASGSQVLSTSKVKEQFAPAQFFDLSDADKLGSKSFEQYNSGVKITGTDELVADHYTQLDVEYELSYIDTPERLAHWGRIALAGRAFNALLAGAAVGRSSLSRKKPSPLAPDKVSLSQEKFAVVDMNNLQLFDDASLLASEAEAAQYLKAVQAANPGRKLQVVPEYGLVA